MSRVPLEFIRSSVRAYLFDSLPEELGNFVTSEVNYLALFVSYIAMGMSSG
jgi:hypothetical protein